MVKFDKMPVRKTQPEEAERRLTDLNMKVIIARDVNGCIRVKPFAGFSSHYHRITVFFPLD